LKPSFDETEGRDFLHDASLILHFVVTKALSLPLDSMKTDAPSQLLTDKHSLRPYVAPHEHS
jgi:hypothetical protein